MRLNPSGRKMIVLSEDNDSRQSDIFQQMSGENIDSAQDMPEDLDFEAAIDKLEEIVNELEGDMLSLEESVEKFTLGMKLIEFCQRELNRAEGRIEQVMEEHGELKDVIPFDWPQEDQ